MAEVDHGALSGHLQGIAAQVHLLPTAVPIAEARFEAAIDRLSQEIHDIGVQVREMEGRLRRQIARQARRSTEQMKLMEGRMQRRNGRMVNKLAERIQLHRYNNSLPRNVDIKYPRGVNAAGLPSTKNALMIMTSAQANSTAAALNLNVAGMTLPQKRDAIFNELIGM